MPRGRRPGPGSAEERAATRREKVRLNVQAFRRRKQGLKEGTGVPTKSALRWMGDTKWQLAYDRQDLESQQDQQSHRGSTGSASTGFGSLAASSPPCSVVYETSDTEHTDEDAIVSAPPLRRLVTTDNAKQEYFNMLSLFPSRFLPNKISLPSSSKASAEIRTPCAHWVTSAYLLARQQTSGPLNDVVMAITTALASLELGREDLLVVSRGLYQRSLSGTRRQLQPIIDHKKSFAGNADAAMVFLACHAASVFELYVNKSFPDMNRHVQGIGILINHQRQFPGFPSSIGDSLLEEYRMLEMNFCFMDRRLSTIRKQARQLPPLDAFIPAMKPKVKPGISIFTTLLDISDYIPVVMVQIDALKQFPPSSKRDRQIHHAIQTLLIVQAQLASWSRYLQYKCTAGLSPNTQDGTALLNNEVDIEKIHSYDYACCWMFCLSYENYALEESIEAAALLSEDPASATRRSSDPLFIPYSTNILRNKLIDSSGKLAQLMSYFFQPEQGIIGRSLAIWPLEACWNALDNEWARLQTQDTELSLDDEEEVILTKTDRRKGAVQKYLQLCRNAAVRGKSYGLPLLRDRG